MNLIPYLWLCVLYMSMQVESLRQGLLKVIPQAVLDLLTWQELERKICGDPMITVEDLKKTSKYSVGLIIIVNRHLCGACLSNLYSKEHNR